MRTLTFKRLNWQGSVNQMLGGSSQLPTTPEREIITSNRWAQFRQHSWKLGGAANIWLTVAKNAFFGGSLNFRVCRVLKDAVTVSLQLDRNTEKLFSYFLSKTPRHRGRKITLLFFIRTKKNCHLLLLHYIISSYYFCVWIKKIRSWLRAFL